MHRASCIVHAICVLQGSRHLEGVLCESRRREPLAARRSARRGLHRPALLRHSPCTVLGLPLLLTSVTRPFSLSYYNFGTYEEIE